MFTRVVTRNRVTSSIALFAYVASAGTALGQATPEAVSHVSIELDSGWTLESALIGNELVGFFAWIPEDEVVSGNVNLAWLEHV